MKKLIIARFLRIIKQCDNIGIYCKVRIIMEILYSDRDIIVCIKPAGVLSTDEPGGLPELIRAQTGFENVRTVHRLDRVVSGLMVLALNKKSASALSEQIREDKFDKRYLAVVHGDAQSGARLEDLLERSKEEKKTYVVDTPSRDSRPAALEYVTLEKSAGMSLVSIKLITGRTHQIRCQFSSREMPLVGDKKYGIAGDDCDIALWSHSLEFDHPYTGKRMRFSHDPGNTYPWSEFNITE